MRISECEFLLDEDECSWSNWKFEKEERRKEISQFSTQLTSKPCFSDGTHTSLLAAQSAWLAAENTEELEVGDPGPAPNDRKRVTSLTPPPVGLDMVLLALDQEGETEKKKKKGGA